MSLARRGYSPGAEPVPGYRLVKRLGRGQFGEVWQATAAGGIDVAIKIIDLGGREGVQEFIALQNVKHVRHPNLVALHAAWLKTEDGSVLDWSAVQAQGAGTRTDYEEALKRASRGQPIAELIIAMGLGSKSLFDRLNECRAENLAGIPSDELLGYMDQAAQGIDYLNQPIHDTGHGPRPIIHCDVKPHNLLIVGNAVQVGDFGLARALEGLRRTATVMATFAYAAPELLDGKRHERSDQYCLAVTYVELRTGELPFNETNPLLVADLHRRGKLDLSRLARAEQKVIRKATSPNPTRRWNTCSDMVSALREACKKSARTVARAPVFDSSDDSMDRGSAVGGTAMPPADFARASSGRTSPEQPVETQIYYQGPTASCVGEAPARTRRWLRVFAVLVFLGLVGGAGALWSDWGPVWYQRAVAWLVPPPRPVLDDGRDQGGNASAEPTPDKKPTPDETPTPPKQMVLEPPPPPPKPVPEPVDQGPKTQLEQARRLMAAGSWAEARKILDPLKPEEWKGLEPWAALCHALRIIAVRYQGEPVESLLGSAAGRGLVQSLEAYDRNQGQTAQTVKADERDQVEAVRMEVLDALVPGRLVKLQAEPQAAAEALQSAERIGGRERKPLELATWTAIFKLGSPTLTLGELNACLAPLEKENQPWRLDRETTKALSEAIERAVSKDWPPAERQGLLDRAIALQRAARIRFPVGLEAQLGPLLARWVELRYLEDRMPEAKEFEALEQDWRMAERSGVRDALVNAWRAECMVEVRRETEAARDLIFPAGDLPAAKASADAKAYLAYVRCLVQQGQVGGPSESLVTALSELLADANRSTRALQTQGRLAKACRWASKAAAERRKEMRAWSAFPPAEANPFSNSAEAAAYAEMLSRAIASGAGHLAAGARRGAILDLALAAACSDKAEAARIESLVKELLDASSQPPDQDEARVLYAYMRSCVTGSQWPSLSKDGEAALVRACTRLLEFRETVGIPFGGGDTAILESVLRWSPSRKGIEPADLEKYCWNMARFIAEQSGANWREKNVRKYVAQLLTQAIELHKDRPAADDPTRRKKEQVELAKYYATRARSLAEQPERDLESLLADADEAIRLDDSQPEGHAMRSHACLLLSRRQARRDELLAYLDKAVAEGERAAGLCRDTERSLPSWLLNLSSAYVEKANYEPHPAEGQVAQWLTAARKHAERAERLRLNLRHQADYPYLAQGNAYEDLAWLAEVDSAENYKLAVNAFREATKQRLYPAEAWTGIGRCYYRAVAETFVNPEDLGLRSNDAVLTEADNAFTEALKADKTQVEACLYRAMVGLYRAMIAHAEKQTEQAEKYFEQAEKGVFEAKTMVSSPDHPLHRGRLMYIAQWARFPLSDQRRSAEKQAAEALSRLQELADDLPTPQGGWIEVRKEKAFIRGQVFVREGNYVKANEQYSQALPSDLAKADVSDGDLLTARAQCARPLYERQAEADKDRQVFARAAADAQRAAEVAKFHLASANAHRLASEVATFYCMTHLDPNAKQLNPETKADWLPYYKKAVEHSAAALATSPRNPQRARWFIDLAAVRGLARHVLGLQEQIANYRQCIQDVEEALKVVGEESPDYKRIRDNELAGLKKNLREKIDARIAEIDQALAAGDNATLREERKELENLKKELP